MKNSNNVLKYIFKNNTGSTPVIIICSAIILILMSAALADVGYFAIERYNIWKISQSTAKYAAMTILNNTDEDISKKAREYAVEEEQKLSEFKINISDDKRAFTVYLGKPFKYTFLWLLDFQDRQITSQCTAKLSNISAYNSIRPFAVLKDEVNFDNEVILKRYDGDCGKPFYIPLVLDSQYRNNIIFGYDKKVNLNDTLFLFDINSKNTDEKKSIDSLIARCDHQPSCTYEKHNIDCPRIIILPVIDKLPVGQAKEMKVIGFTAFFLKECNEEIGIKGKFIKHLVRSDSSDGINDFGLMSLKIIK